MHHNPATTRPFEDTSADLFTSGNHKYVVYVDKFSGWPTAHGWKHDPSTAQVVNTLTNDFCTYGTLLSMHTDGGPQFASAARNSLLSGTSPPATLPCTTPSPTAMPKLLSRRNRKFICLFHEPKDASLSTQKSPEGERERTAQPQPHMSLAAAQGRDVDPTGSDGNFRFPLTPATASLLPDKLKGDEGDEPSKQYEDENML